jgi:hypothetical protein
VHLHNFTRSKSEVYKLKKSKRESQTKPHVKGRDHSLKKKVTKFIKRAQEKR